MNRCFFIFFFVLAFFGNLFGQPSLYSLWGIVRDQNTREPLPYANIRELGTSRGTTTNDAGKYILLLPVGYHIIVFSYLGYQSDTLHIEIKDQDVQRNINLNQTSFSLPEIVVSAYRYNPAERIILKAIARKHRTLSHLHSYEFRAYTKTVFRVVRKKEAQRDTVIMGILETQTSGYWKEPDLYKEIITARRQTANFSPANNFFTVGRIPNFNDDVIVLERNSVIGPTSPNALKFYSYEMIDTTAINNVMVFRIKIIPRYKNIPLFRGVISIADSTFSVMEVDVSGNEALDLAPRRNIRYRQQFALYENRFWLPIEIHIDYEIKLSFPGTPPVYVEQISLLHDYKINRPLPETLFDKFEVSVKPTADRVDSLTWSSQQFIPLTPEEVRGYHRLDSLIANARFIPKAILFLMRTTMGLRKLPITTFSDYFHFNRVEGAYVGLGLKMKHVFPGVALQFKTGYGFSDKNWKYGLVVEKPLFTDGQSSLGIELYKRISFREPEPIYSANTVSFLCLTDKNDYYDYYRAKGWQFFTRLPLAHRLGLKIGFTAETHQSVQKRTDFSLLHRSVEYRQNPPIVPGDFRGMQLLLTYDTRKFVDAGLFVVPLIGRSSWKIYALYEYTDNRFFGSDFSFSRFFLSAHHRRLTFANGFLDLHFQLGASRGPLPPQKLFDLPSRVGGLSPFGVFQTSGIREFAGDQLAALLFEHNFGSLPFRSLNLPILRKIRPDFIVTGGAGWTELSSRSEKIQTKKIIPTKTIFYEAGFSLGRILTFFRINLSWRFTHRRGDNFVLSISSDSTP